MIHIQNYPSMVLISAVIVVDGMDVPFFKFQLLLDLTPLFSSLQILQGTLSWPVRYLNGFLLEFEEIPRNSSHLEFSLFP